MLKRARIIRIVLYSLLTILVLTLISGGYVWYSMHKTISAMYEPLPSTKWVEPVFESETLPSESPDPVDNSSNNNEQTTQAAVNPLFTLTANTLDDIGAERLRHPSLSKEDPFSMLILGVDERPGDRGRSDTMILLTLLPQQEAAVAISIPRDTRVLMPNSGKYDKINHAYAFGGTSLAVEAVEKLFGVPIAYYMKTNMEGYVKIVDTLNGVDVTNAREFTSIFHFPKGSQHLNGDQALAYIRMRKEDPQGDFGRTQRQRDVLTDAIKRVTSVSSITKLPKLLSLLADNVKTNLTAQNMLDLAKDYKPLIKKVDTLILDGKGTMINGIYYYTVTPEERKKIQDQLLSYLNVN
ncbi:LCP family glycopolymer transferase [Cohnella abietis]|uniref:Cell envelope-related transcriptional attenuator domain-containing protein n=1 Tax=Cohnella abietis TaxID=2507935 RepID=A0A3T1D0Y3_9BACL|nr:LCP family protein [Cohnella abietis]BBI31760.1 hypothetical protein KCTCHS21_11590 [Cohnella abietis]